MTATTTARVPNVTMHRGNYVAAAPNVVQAMLQLSAATENLSIEKRLQQLVKLRASQINGCAFCIHMHTREARAAGETEDRMHLLSAWRESPLYSARERAALAWTEALTELSKTGAPDEAYAALAAEFTEKEQAELTLAIVLINGWNRFAVGFRAQHPAESTAAAAA